MNLKYCLLLTSIVLLVYEARFVSAKLSDLRLCGDSKCEVPVSEAISVQRYISPDKNVLSVPPNTKVIIYSKSAGTNKDLWGVEVNGKRGYLPLKFLKETKVYTKELKHIVPVEESTDSVVEQGKTQEKIIAEPTVEKPKQRNTVIINGDDVEYENIKEHFEEKALDKEVDAESIKETTSSNNDKVDENNIEENSNNEEDEEDNEGDEEDNEEEEETGEDEDDDEELVAEDENSEEEMTKDEGNESLNKENLETKESSQKVVTSIDKESTSTSSNNEADLSKTKDKIEAGKVKLVPVEESSNQNTETVTQQPDDIVESVQQMTIETTTESIFSTIEDASQVDQELPTSIEPTESTTEYLVVDGTTIYLDDPLPGEFDPQYDDSPQEQYILESSDSNMPGSPQSQVEGSYETTPDSGNAHNVPTSILEDYASATLPVVVTDSPVSDDAVKKTVNEEIVPSDTASATEDDWFTSVSSLTGNWFSGDAKGENKDIKDNKSKEDIKGDNEGKNDKKGDNKDKKDRKSINKDEGNKDLEDAVSEVTENKIVDDTNAPDKEEADSSSHKEEAPVDDDVEMNQTEEKNPIAANTETIKDNEDSDMVNSEITDAAGNGVQNQGEGGFFTSLFGSSQTKGSEEVESKHAADNEEKHPQPADNDEKEQQSASSSTVKEELQPELSNEEKDHHAASNDDESQSTSKNEEINPSSTSTDDESNNNFVSKDEDIPLTDSEVKVSQTETTYKNDEADKSLEASSEKLTETRTAYSTEEELTDVNNTVQESDITGSSQSTTLDLTYSDIEKVEEEKIRKKNEENGDSHDNDSDEASQPQHHHKKLQKSDKDQDEPIVLSLVKKFHSILGDDLTLALEAELLSPRMSTGAVSFLGIVAISIITCYFIHLIFTKWSREAPLLEAMNRIDKEYRIALAELAAMKEQGPAMSQTSNDSEMNAIFMKQRQELQDKLQKLETEASIERELLQKKITLLEQELEESTNNGMEMHKMLEELLTSQKESSAFQDSVNDLQVMLDNQREVVDNLKSDLAIKTRVNEELQVELKNNKDKTIKLEHQIEQLSHSLEDVNKSKLNISTKLDETSSSMQQLQQLNEELSAQTQTATSQIQSLDQQILQLANTIKLQTDSLGTKEAELQISKQCLKQLTCLEDNGSPISEEKLSKIFNMIEVKSKLQTTRVENKRLSEELSEEHNTNSTLKKDIAELVESNDQLQHQMSEAVKQSEEAKGKLSVLTQYFKEKEAQLTKELESQEGLRLSAEGSAENIAKKIQGLELEVSTCRGTIATLQKELEEQDQSYKQQISNYEQKSHDSWLTARAAERKQEDLKQENSQLRQKLNVLHKEKEDAARVQPFKPTPKRAGVSTNGSVSSPVLGVDEEVDELTNNTRALPPLPPLPPFFPPPPGMLPPPPPGMPPFMGPLPPPLSDRRLPPAGRMASPPYRWQRSPPLDRRSYSPGSDHSHFSDHHRYSPDSRSDHHRHSPPMHRGPQGRRGSSPPRSPDGWYNRSPDPYSRNRSPPRYYPDNDHNDDPRQPPPGRGKKTSTPLGAADR